MTLTSSTSKRVFLSLAFLAVGVCGIYGFSKAKHLIPPRLKDGGWVSGTVELYRNAWESVGLKLDALRHADEENERLRFENAVLRSRLETYEFAQQSHQGENWTQRVKKSLTRETGTPVGRQLANMNYKPPKNLLPSQLYTLGVSYLKAREDEKAARIFTSLTNGDENEAYRTAKNFLITGVAWYRVDNFALANLYFSEALKKPEDLSSLPFQAQARLWKALVAQKLHQDGQVQYWLKELLEHHPHSEEEEWVRQNRRHVHFHSAQAIPQNIHGERKKNVHEE